MASESEREYRRMPNTLRSEHGLRRVSSPYRPEIDGLRALAVVAVVLHHLNRDQFGLGHLGVDVFFVISGYVVTQSLALRREASAALFLSGFY